MDLSCLQHIQPIWIQATAALGSAIAAFCAFGATRAQATFSKRALLLQVATDMKTLKKVNVTTPAKAQVEQTLNIFEYVGHMCEAGVLDEELVETIWGDAIIEICQQITSIAQLDGRTGQKWLSDSVGAERLYNRIKAVQSLRKSWQGRAQLFGRRLLGRG